MTQPVFTKREDARGVIWVCTINGHEGAARVMSKGEQDARDRAEQQARDKLEAKRGATQ